MFKKQIIKKENIFQNFLQNRGCKYKAEKSVKKALKLLQKKNRKKISHELLQRSLILSAEGVSVVKQTIKKGKRKRVIQQTMLLVSEKARFSKACQNIINLSRQNKKTSQKEPQYLATAIQNINESLLSAVANPSSNAFLDRSATTKFRW